MTIKITHAVNDLYNPNENEVQELAKVINLLDEANIDYDLEPPINKSSKEGRNENI